MHACKLRGMKDHEYSYSGSQDSVKKVHGNMPRPYRVTLKEAAANAEPWCSGSRSLQHCDKCCSPAHYRASSRATALDKNDVSRQATALCLLTETHLRPGEVFRLANYVCHRTAWPMEGGGTAILVRRGIDHYAIPVPGLTQLEATAIHIT